MKSSSLMSCRTLVTHCPAINASPMKMLAVPAPSPSPSTAALWLRRTTTVPIATSATPPHRCPEIALFRITRAAIVLSMISDDPMSMSATLPGKKTSVPHLIDALSRLNRPGIAGLSGWGIECTYETATIDSSVRPVSEPDLFLAPCVCVCCASIESIELVGKEFDVC